MCICIWGRCMSIWDHTEDGGIPQVSSCIPLHLTFQTQSFGEPEGPVSARVAGRQAPSQDLPALLPITWTSDVCRHAQLSQEFWGLEHRSFALTVSAFSCGETIALTHAFLSKCFGDRVWRKSLISCSPLNTQMVQITQGFEISHSKMLSPLCRDAFCLVK